MSDVTSTGNGLLDIMQAISKLSQVEVVPLV